MSKTPRSNPRPVRWRVEGIFGSTGKACDAIYDLLASRGTDTPLAVGRLIVDFNETSPADLTYGPNGEKLKHTKYFVQTQRPTGPISLRQAEQDGFIHGAKDWDRHAQVASDGDGAGGVPRNGYEMVSVVGDDIKDRRMHLIQQVIDYETRIQPVTDEGQPARQISRIPIHVLVSTCGGTGTGALVWFVTECIPACAWASRVEAKIVPHLLSLGNLPTHDKQQARMNEFVTFKFIQTLATGAFVDPATGRILPVPFDHVRDFSNMNNTGAIGSLKKFVHHHAQLSHFIANTPAGADMQEREPDIGHWSYDRFEDPRCVYTAGTACIHLNMDRLLESLAYRAASLLSECLLAEGDSDRVIRDAAALAEAANVVESEDENQLTTTVSNSDELPGETLFGRAEQGLMDAIAGTRGIERGRQLCEKIPLIRNGDIPSPYRHQMQEKAQSVVEAAMDLLERRLDQILKQSQGLWEAITLLQFVLAILDRSRQAATEKAGQLHEFLIAHEHALAEGAEQLQDVAEQGLIGRSMRFQVTRAINASLEESGRAAINYQLQIAACTVAIENVLAPLVDFVEQKQADLLATRQSLTELVPHSLNVAHNKADERTVHDPAVGLELVSAPYVSRCFAEHLARAGGPDPFVAQLRSLFLQQHGSFEVLVSASFPEMEQSLVDLCRSAFRPGVQKTNVLIEFRRVHPDEETRRKILTELIGQSEGRLPVEGEINRPVAWIKTANVPSADDAEWMRRLLEDADHKAGKWQVAVNPADPETFSMAQLRGEISLAQFINRLGVSDNAETWKRLAVLAAEPVSALMAGPNPTPSQFRRVLAKAIATGLLTINAKGCFAFRSSTGEEWLLGKDAEAVREKLQPRFRQQVFVESSFACQLIDAETRTITQLADMKARVVDQASSSDPLLSLIDVTAIDECLLQAELLKPWASRLQKVRRRISA